MADAILTINSRNYGAWSLRGWLLCELAGLEIEVRVLPSDDPSSRAELMLLAPSFLVPRLTHGNVVIWDTLAIGEYLHEWNPDAGLLPSDPADRARCRSISGEMHSGFVNLRSSLPMNLKARYSDFPLWAGAQADVDRVTAIWRDCLAGTVGPYLFGATPTMADAMYAPVCTRSLTYDVKLDPECAAYSDSVLAMEEMREWIEVARLEAEDIDELEMEF